MDDPLGFGYPSKQPTPFPYIVIVVDLVACSLKTQYTTEGATGARNFAAKLKQKLREAHDPHQQNIAVDIELIADRTIWNTLFLTHGEFILGFNEYNNCRISYHTDFIKLADGECMAISENIM